MLLAAFPDYMLRLCVAGVGVFLINVSILVTARWHLNWTSRQGDVSAVQASHKASTPRIGGLSIYIGLLIGLLVVPTLDQPWCLKLLVAATPVWIAGLLEDCGRLVSPRGRLIASAFSAMVAVYLTGALVIRVDLPFDVILGFVPFALLFTMFCVAGVCHAMNLVDGMNGLSGVLSLFAATGLAIISHAHGEPSVTATCILLMSVIVGFLMVNFPFGLIFLGDAGAYLIGFVLAWISVQVLHDRPEVSPWSILLVNFWHVADTFLTIYRRMSSGKAIGMPDRMHFHQLVRRFLVIRVLGRRFSSASNPLTTLAIAPFALVPVTLGIVWADDLLYSGVAVAGFAGLFVVTYYGLLTASRKRFPTKRVQRLSRKIPGEALVRWRVVADRLE